LIVQFSCRAADIWNRLADFFPDFQTEVRSVIEYFRCILLCNRTASNNNYNVYELTFNFTYKHVILCFHCRATS